MNMSNDPIFLKMLQEIESLRNGRDMYRSDIDELKAQIKRLTVERDEARRWLCQRLEWFEGGDGTQAANERGWDCFKGQIYD